MVVVVDDGGGVFITCHTPASVHTSEQLVQRLTDSGIVDVRRPDAGYQALPRVLPDHSHAMRSHPEPPMMAECLQANLTANNHESDE